MTLTAPTSPLPSRRSENARRYSDLVHLSPCMANARSFRVVSVAPLLFVRECPGRIRVSSPLPRARNIFPRVPVTANLLFPLFCPTYANAPMLHCLNTQCCYSQGFPNSRTARIRKHRTTCTWLTFQLPMFCSPRRPLKFASRVNVHYPVLHSRLRAESFLTCRDVCTIFRETAADSKRPLVFR